VGTEIEETVVPPRDRSLRILVAEDSLVNQKLATVLLERLGHEVLVASNGKEAVDLLASHAFDLVLMDVHMPEMDGLEATEIIRAREKETGAHVPILAMTGDVMQDSAERCRQAGMSAVLAKPIRKRDLHAAVVRMTAGREPVEVPSSSGSGAGGPDWAAALDAVDGDRDLLEKLVQVFFKEYPLFLNKLRASVDQGDADGVRHAAHQLNGSIRFLSAKRASELALQLETMGRDGKLGNASEVLTSLEAEIQQVAPAFRDLPQRIDSGDKN
jgi:CheY-like chemotaxis protein